MNYTALQSPNQRIRLAIAGVGNCASALVQGLSYYGDNRTEGLITPIVGGYRPSDIDVVTAYDIDRRKVGRPLEDAIFASPNCAMIFEPRVRPSNVRVKMVRPLDGVAQHMAQSPEGDAFRLADAEPIDVVSDLRQVGADVLVCYVPVGSDQAARFFAQACLDAGVAFVNAMPSFIASDKVWADKFAAARIPVIGDDVKSQVGATILHRALAHLMTERGYRVKSTYQLNFGGNTDFLNMLDRGRLHSKKTSKTGSVLAAIDTQGEPLDIHVGPSDYVRWLNDNKIAYIRLEGRGFGGAPISMELRLSVEDSPNSAAVIMDAIRLAKLARDRGLGGPVEPACAYYMKSPPRQMVEDEARDLLDAFLQP